MYRVSSFGRDIYNERPINEEEKTTAPVWLSSHVDHDDFCALSLQSYA
jgi:hypothetical protein